MWLYVSSDDIERAELDVKAPFLKTSVEVYGLKYSVFALTELCEVTNHCARAFISHILRLLS